jgi:hypothetical protein
VTLDDSSSLTSGSPELWCEVLVDGVHTWRSRPLSKALPEALSVPVFGATTITLRVVCVSGDTNAARAVWIHPRIVSRENAPIKGRYATV